MCAKFACLTVVAALCLGAQPMCGGGGSGSRQNENNNIPEPSPPNDGGNNQNFNNDPDPPPDDPPPENDNDSSDPPGNNNESEPPPANDNDDKNWEEPPLELFSCDDFPPLLLEGLPGETFVRPLVPGESTYIWLPSTWGCNQMTGDDDPEGPPDCTHLLLGAGGIGLDEYKTVLRFDVNGLPESDKVETAAIELHILEGEGFYSSYIYVDRLDEPW